MKGFSLFIWTIVIISSVYVVSSFFSGFDVSKVDPEIKKNVFGDRVEEISTTSLSTTTTSSTASSTITIAKDPKYFGYDGVYYRKSDLPSGFRKIYTPTGSIYVKISDDEQERETGLSGITSIDKDVGMLFIFGDSKIRNFWMKDMNFPLDMVWIGENKKVLSVSENILPESYPNSISSSEPAKYVLELNAFMAKMIGLKAGSSIVF